MVRSCPSAHSGAWETPLAITQEVQNHVNDIHQSFAGTASSDRSRGASSVA